MHNIVCIQCNRSTAVLRDYERVHRKVHAYVCILWIILLEYSS